MKRYLQAWAMCRSMFCFIPSPWRVWNEDARPLMLMFLPLLGLEIGALWWGAAWLLCHFSVSSVISALVLCAYPIAVTGAIHFDGFMDVVDAVRSCAAPEKRREILKDPHVGSFAVVGCALALLAGYSIFSVGKGDIRLLLLIPVVSRCGSALAVTLLPPMSTSQYAVQQINRSHAVTLLLMLAAATRPCSPRGPFRAISRCSPTAGGKTPSLRSKTPPSPGTCPAPSNWTQPPAF